MDLILLKQLPVIHHDLKKIGANARKLIAELNLDTLIATDDTLQYLKKTRAELNKEFVAYEEQRKAVKKAIMTPYDAFDLEYKTEITNVFMEAETKLKTGIMSVEIKAKDIKKEVIKAYFSELCVSNDIDFVTFEQTGIEINLSTSEKQYKEKCQEFVSKIKDDLKIINAYKDSIDAIVEYKKTLNLSGTIIEIKRRKEAEEIEKQKTNKPFVEAPAPVIEVLKAPDVVDNEILTASFIVKGTKDKLLALRSYLIENNFDYKNL